MPAISYIVSAPGSLMLMGEHAVLADKLALCAAVDLRIKIILQPRIDDLITITSEVFPSYQTTIKQLKIEQPYQFILAALKTYQTKLLSGCNIIVESDFSPLMGLGSSAAVTVAIIKALQLWLELPSSAEDCFISAREVIRLVQGLGSGTDVAASVWGGVIAYQQQAQQPILLTGRPELTAVYCGYKTPTVKVLTQVQKNFLTRTTELNDLYCAIDSCTQQALLAWEQQDWTKVGKLFNEHFILQQALGVSDAALNHIVHRLQQQPESYGAKISGSGLGDSAIGLGVFPPLFPDNILPLSQQFIVSIANQGVMTHAN